MDGRDRFGFGGEGEGEGIMAVRRLLGVGGVGLWWLRARKSGRVTMYGIQR